jgi:demethylmenaquinone methyltransferase/2-methoxy-6-polyprenyl-1,4-benzoquinol methylase
MEDQEIYDPGFVKDLFDRCSTAYRFWSQIASFGFVWLWRRQCIDALPVFDTANAAGADLMTGTGECWSYLLKRRPGIRSITAVDISTGMIERAIGRLHQSRRQNITVLNADLFRADLPASSFDFVICVFGMKTFNRDQHRLFARELARILKPGGVFSLVEASDPKGWMLRPVYLFYLNRFLPLIEQHMLRGAKDFSMLGVYARNFGDCREIRDFVASEGLEAEYVSYFFGCATGVRGKKPKGEALSKAREGA